MADSVEIAKAYVQIVPSMEGAQSAITKGLSGASGEAGEKSAVLFGSKFSGGAKKALKAGAVAIAAAGAAATKGAIDLATSTADYGDAVDKASQKMGIGSSAFQEWDAVLKHAGTSMDAMAPSFKKLSTQAQSGSDKTSEAFKKIGLSMDEVKSMSTEDLWSATIKGLQGMEAGTERTAVASQLLGRGATELGAVLNTSAEDTQKMIDTVNNLGGVMSEEGVKNSAAFKDALQDAETALAAVGRSIGANMLPTLTSLLEGFNSIAAGNTAEGLSKIKEAFTNLLPEGLKSTFDSVTSTVADKLAPAFEDAKTFVDDLGKSFDDFMEENGPALTDMFGTVASVISSVMPVITSTVRTAMGLLGPIVRGAVNNITTAFRGLNAVIGIAKTVFSTVKGAISDPINTAKTLVQKGIDAIKGIFSGAKLQLPHINLPHFKISGEFSIKNKTVPSLSIDWYAKGGVFDGPSVIGVGEAGPEAVVPLSGERMRPFAQAIAAEGGGSVTNNFYLTYNAGESAVKMVQDIARELERVRKRG